MKIIILDKGKVGIITIVIGLMILIAGMGYYFDENIRSASFLQNNINSLKLYSCMNGKITYKLPAEWQTDEENNSKSGIIYNAFFASESGGINGFIQVWKSEQDLKTFSDQSKKILGEQNTFKNYKMRKEYINGTECYIADYVLVAKNTNEYKTSEYIIKHKNDFVTFTFYVENSAYKESMSTNFHTIVSTLNCKD